MASFKILIVAFSSAFATLSAVAQGSAGDPVSQVAYNVVKIKSGIPINGDWKKKEWRRAESVKVDNFIREQPQFRPNAEAKMMYDDENIYVIFRVHDKYVRSITTDINGPVWKDSAVEFFFSPDTVNPLNYFNLEVNCGGIPLLGYHSETRVRPKIDDIKKIEIAHSQPVKTDPEVTEELTWTVEYRIPLQMIKNYSNVTKPAPGVTWRGNFYKIAEINSNPHHASWSVINHPKPTFHLPQFFGLLKFQ